MISIEKSAHATLILKKLVMPWGTIYLLKDAVVSELNYGVVGTADHVYEVLEAALAFYEKHDVVKKRVWIANRTEKYSIKPVEWINMKRIAVKYLKGYCVVDNTRIGILNALLESKFVPVNFKSVKTLDQAVVWTQQLMSDDKDR